MPNTSQGMTLLTNAFVARVQAELRTLEQAPIGRKKRVTSRSITDEIKALKGTDNDIIWMACAVVHAKIQIAGQKRLRSDEKQAKKRAKGQGAPNALSRIPKTAMDLMDREKRDDEMAKVVIYGLKASSEYRRLKGQVDREFGVKAKHTKLPSKTLRATASLLCDRFKQITGKPCYAVVGSILTSSGLMSDEWVPEDQSYRKAGERIRELLSTSKTFAPRKSPRRTPPSTK